MEAQSRRTYSADELQAALKADREEELEHPTRKRRRSAPERIGRPERILTWVSGRSFHPGTACTAEATPAWPGGTSTRPPRGHAPRCAAVPSPLLLRSGHAGGAAQHRGHNQPTR